MLNVYTQLSFLCLPLCHVPPSLWEIKIKIKIFRLTFPPLPFQPQVLIKNCTLSASDVASQFHHNSYHDQPWGLLGINFHSKHAAHSFSGARFSTRGENNNKKYLHILFSLALAHLLTLPDLYYQTTMSVYVCILI